MVIPTPFERLLQQTVQLANTDRLAAFTGLKDLYGKSLTEQDLLQLSGFAVHLGAGDLTRFEETITFLHQLLTHPALRAEGVVARSLWRALSVVHILAGQADLAKQSAAKGVTTRSEECLLAIGAAQMLAIKGRFNEVMSHLRQATTIVGELEPGDEVVRKVATTTAHLLRQTEPQARMLQEFILVAAAAHHAAFAHSSEWHHPHGALFQQGHAYLLAAKPGKALACVQGMMDLEDQHDAGAYERFHTASLACRAQAIRGQFKIAGGALEACQDFAKRITVPEQSEVVRLALLDLENFVAEARGD